MNEDTSARRDADDAREDAERLFRVALSQSSEAVESVRLLKADAVNAVTTLSDRLRLHAVALWIVSIVAAIEALLIWYLWARL
ncbi:hypothetical protein [Methylobacterium sp. E-045]|uniref:hypothetical protein n=1 Tax=Methylobacterium sp. E-045 TaxID=2836575 RepID=UPI001FBAA410|nr:hypothetical protein [Methylobacterium sp. E-045]MCJ2129195.1 hypothetical protein [Methylobacterium sp. E-045]